MIAASTPNAHIYCVDREQATIQTAIRSAEQLLADTVHKINPDTPIRTLHACIARYRVQLAELVAACRSQEGY